MPASKSERHTPKRPKCTSSSPETCSAGTSAKYAGPKSTPAATSPTQVVGIPRVKVKCTAHDAAAAAPSMAANDNPGAPSEPVWLDGQPPVGGQFHSIVHVLTNHRRQNAKLRGDKVDFPTAEQRDCREVNQSADSRSEGNRARPPELCTDGGGCAAVGH